MLTRNRPAVLDSHSIEAAALQTEEHVTKVQVVILDIFNRCGELTDDALIALYDARADANAAVPHATPQSIRSRRAELTRKGLVRAVGRIGLSAHGNKCTTWALTNKEEIK
ncbi:MAG: hypothetical protein QM677_02550 [Microbacterium sp.]